MSDEEFDEESSGYLEDSDISIEYVADEDDEVRQDQCKPSFQVITKNSLLAAQMEDLQKVASMLGVKMQHARTLLIHHRWDVEALFSKLADKGKDRLFEEAGLSFLVTGPSNICKELPDIITCGTCYEEVPKLEVTQMDCGHSFCNACWGQCFVLNIKEGQSKRLKCMEHKCDSICDEDAVRRLVGARDPPSLQKYEHALLESYIEDNSRVKWCPSTPGCGNAIRVEGEPYCEIECICGQQFCFNCKSEAHSPCSCLMWQLWDKKCKDESETVNWMTVHTKPCPKCHKPVEKNGGCNLVGCICGQAFCWLCGAATGRQHNWSRIEGHSCGRYKEDREREAARAERDLKRYTHYHSRWKGHMDSLKLEAKQRESVQFTIGKLEASQSLVKDYSWLTNGLQRLFRARRALSYSYVFAFFMFGNDLFKDDISVEQNTIHQHLFEDQQQQFEETVERLSKAIETPLELSGDDSFVNQTRFDVINLSTLTDNLCKRMYSIIEDELLAAVHLTTHHIAPYKSQGPERAAEILFRDNEEQNTVSFNQDGDNTSCLSKASFGFNNTGVRTDVKVVETSVSEQLEDKVNGIGELEQDKLDINVCKQKRSKRSTGDMSAAVLQASKRPRSGKSLASEGSST